MQITVNEQKKLLRKVMLQKRKELSDSETAVKNSAITEKLLELEKVQSAELILPFVSARGEVGTREFIARCFVAEKTVAVPRCIDGSNMEFCVIHTFDDLEKGMYGIDESMRVLDDLYGVETQYYARVNFYGLTKIVDALGGVDVYSEQTFTTKVMQIPDKNGNLYDDYFSFTEGMNYNVDGQAALAFCRERYSFSDGDNQRGRNQMAMIKAIFNKATSPAILSTYGEVLNAVADTMITNMPYEDISSLVKMQLSDMSGWNITSYSVTGYGGTEECYSMPGQALWVMWPDYDTVNVAKDLIAQVMAGQTPVIPED